MQKTSVDLIGDIQNYVIKNNLSRAQLAEILTVSQSTIDKLLGGFSAPSPKLLKKISIKLGLNVGNLNPYHHFTINNPDRKLIIHLEGKYQAVRASFRENGCFHAYVLNVYWDEKISMLLFDETDNELAPLNKGYVSVPPYNRALYFLSCENGNFRLKVVSDAYEKGIFYGGIMTLGSPRMSTKTPTASIIVLKKVTDVEEPAFGTIRPDHAHFGEFEALINFGRDEGFFIAHP